MVRRIDNRRLEDGELVLPLPDIAFHKLVTIGNVTK
jgi:hypothetical protein